jgi:hypothetical protein
MLIAVFLFRIFFLSYRTIFAGYFLYSHFIILLLLFHSARLVYKLYYNIPDLIINRSENDVYLKRWHIIPRNILFNIYLHHFHKSDDDNLHDHPFLWNASIILHGSYTEWVPVSTTKWLNNESREIMPIRRSAFWPVLRFGRSIHRIELDNQTKVWTLFITGQIVRSWSFYCPDKEVDHKDYLIHIPDPDTNSIVSKKGRGCE